MKDEDYETALDQIEAEIETEYLRQIEALVSSVEIARVDESVERDGGGFLVRLVEGAAFLAVMEALRRAFLRGARGELASVSVYRLAQVLTPAASPGASLYAASTGYTQTPAAAPQPSARAKEQATTFDFDPRRPGAEAAIRAQAETLAAAIRDAQRAAVQAVMQGGAMRGQPTRQTALDLAGRVSKVTGRRTGGVIGLTGADAQYAENARIQLLSGDPAQMRAYLQRQRRDSRFDGLVRRAIEAAQADPLAPPIARQDVDRIVGRYADRLLETRAQAIATRESTKALNGGRAAVYEQVAGEGADPARIVKTWRHRGDNRVRDTHQAMGGQSVRLDEPFVSPSGARLMFPGDDSRGAPESERAGCRCRLKFAFKRGPDA